MIGRGFELEKIDGDEDRKKDGDEGDRGRSDHDCTKKKW